MDRHASVRYGDCAQYRRRTGPETALAGGRVDILFTGTLNDGRSVRVCVEIKCAHNDEAEHGFATQLPAYMRAKGTDLGIYVVLWFRGKHFDEPACSQFELSLRLMKASDRVPPLPILFIDASFRPPPSQQ